MTQPADILPLERESRKAYEARRHYLLSGKDRSLSRTSRDTGMSLSAVKRLSTEWNWAKSAYDFDTAAAQAAAQAAWASYQEQVDRHKQLCIAMGQSLIAEGREMLAQFSAQRREGMRYTPTMLNTIMRAFQVGAELQAHGLGIDRTPDAPENPEADPAHMQIEYVNDWRVETYDYGAAGEQLSAPGAHLRIVKPEDD